MTKVTNKKEEMQKKCTTTLQEKSEVEDKFERMLKEKSEVEKKAKKSLKEKDDAEKMAQQIQTVVQNLCKEILEVPMVVEDTMEEKVSRIDEVIKGLHTKIEDLESCTMLGTHLEEKEQREKKTTTSVVNIKSLYQECERLCDKSMQIWTKLMMNPELKEIEDRIGST
jgi:DNA repair exonuclease SbcCD ATPase subunit